MLGSVVVIPDSNLSGILGYQNKSFNGRRVRVPLQMRY